MAYKPLVFPKKLNKLNENIYNKSRLNKTILEEQNESNQYNRTSNRTISNNSSI